MQTFTKTILALSMVAQAATAQTSDPLRFSDYPALSQAEREGLDVELLRAKTQLELDKLYSQLPSGSTPNGIYQGTVVFDESGEADIEQILAVTVPPQLADWMKKLGTRIWGGKTFDRQSGTLTNQIGSVQRFPAAVFCGQSLLDSRRESIVLDYAFGDQLDGYVAALDWPMTRYGLSIRDEMRMVKPGLYLGRAYIRGLFATNFILHSEAEEQAGVWDNQCKS